MMYEKAIRKHGIGKIANASRDIAPGPHKGGEGKMLAAPHMNPQLQWPMCRRTLGYGLRS